MPQNQQDVPKRTEEAEGLVRQGYVAGVSNGRKVVMPTVLQEYGVDLSLAAVVMPDLSQAVNMPIGPGVTKKLYSTPMAGGLVEARVDPGHSERERHLLHAEVKALQETLGLSYKDAAHRLFMAEVERVKKADAAAKSFAAIRRSLESVVQSDIIPPILAIDEGELDDYVWRDGKWSRRSEIA